MQRFLASLALVAMLLLAPIVLHADTLMTGQFVITGTVQNVGTTLMFDPANLFTGTGTQTGTFATLLSDHQGFNGGTANITFCGWSCPGFARSGDRGRAVCPLPTSGRLGAGRLPQPDRLGSVRYESVSSEAS